MLAYFATQRTSGSHSKRLFCKALLCFNLSLVFYQFENLSEMSSRPELKVDDEHGFISFFNKLPERDENTIRIFERGDYYTVHGEDAIFVAQNVLLLYTIS